MLIVVLIVDDSFPTIVITLREETNSFKLEIQ